MIPQIILKDVPCYAFYSLITGEIGLNLALIHRLALNRNIDFEVQVARCINHEYLHHFLFVEHGAETTTTFDDLCWNDSYSNIDYWMW